MDDVVFQSTLLIYIQLMNKHETEVAMLRERWEREVRKSHRPKAQQACLSWSLMYTFLSMLLSIQSATQARVRDGVEDWKRRYRSAEEKLQDAMDKVMEYDHQVR